MSLWYLSIFLDISGYLCRSIRWYRSHGRWAKEQIIRQALVRDYIALVHGDVGCTKRKDAKKGAKKGIKRGITCTRSIRSEGCPNWQSKKASKRHKTAEVLSFVSGSFGGLISFDSIRSKSDRSKGTFAKNAKNYQPRGLIMAPIDKTHYHITRRCEVMPQGQHAATHYECLAEFKSKDRISCGSCCGSCWCWYMGLSENIMAIWLWKILWL